MPFPRNPHVFRSDMAGQEYIVVCSTRQTPDEAKLDVIATGLPAEMFGTGRLQCPCPTFPGFQHFVFAKDLEQDGRE